MVDEAGAPVTNTVVWGRYPEGTDHGDHNLYDESVARIGGLEPGKPRTVLIQQRDRKIGAVSRSRPAGDRNAARSTVTLRPTPRSRAGSSMARASRPAAASGLIDAERGPRCSADPRRDRRARRRRALPL